MLGRGRVIVAQQLELIEYLEEIGFMLEAADPDEIWIFRLLTGPGVTPWRVRISRMPNPESLGGGFVRWTSSLYQNSQVAAHRWTAESREFTSEIWPSAENEQFEVTRNSEAELSFAEFFSRVKATIRSATLRPPAFRAEVRCRRCDTVAIACCSKCQQLSCVKCTSI